MAEALTRAFDEPATPATSAEASIAPVNNNQAVPIYKRDHNQVNTKVADDSQNNIKMRVDRGQSPEQMQAVFAQVFAEAFDANDAQVAAAAAGQPQPPSAPYFPVKKMWSDGSVSMASKMAQGLYTPKAM